MTSTSATATPSAVSPVSLVRGNQVRSQGKDDELKRLAQLGRSALFEDMGTRFTGLDDAEAEQRLDEVGPNIVAGSRPTPWYMIILHSLNNPFVFVLAGLAAVSFVTGSVEAGAYMCFMIVLSAVISFTQEYKSQQASIALREMIENTTNVKRNGEYAEIPMDEVVPGDLIQLKTGDMIPADSILLSGKDLFINQSSMTGESFPVEKRLPEDLDEDELVDWTTITALDAPNILFMGTDVLSGAGEILVVKTGPQTMFGDLATASTSTRVTSAFETGLSRVSKLLLVMVVTMFVVVFLINWLTKGDTKLSALDAFFFAIAVAVGLTPELLPMIVNTNLAKGAVALSKKKVIVKRLSAIQNLGSMDILCTDKTGTITEDRVVMIDYVNVHGNKSNKVLNAAFLNSYYQTGWKNLMDFAVIDYFTKHEKKLPYLGVAKVDEIPFDFQRRLLSVVVKIEGDSARQPGEEESEGIYDKLLDQLPDVQSIGKNLMITKGAVEEMQTICTYVLEDGQILPLTNDKLAEMEAVSQEMNLRGMRTLAVAEKVITDEELEVFDTGDETAMTLIGFLGFLDPAKESAIPAIASLHAHGVAVKVLTGDNAIVAQKVCEEVGIGAEAYLLGSDIDKLDEEQLFTAAMATNLFAKLSPMQKSRIIETLRKVHTVGFMGDGINDAPSLRMADVGISVDTAADITKDASSIILLEKSLEVLETGVQEGRKVFSNMMKYIRITLSSNFGNVFSVLVASAFLPFLPMLSVQILTLNLFYDISQLSIPWDNVDSEEIEKPVKWNTRGLAKFAMLIGPTSSIFDITTFLVLWFVFGFSSAAYQGYFQAGWFAESLATQALAFHILRTRRLPFVQSIASPPVIMATIGAFGVGALFVFTPVGRIISMPHMPAMYWVWWVGIVVCYIVLLQAWKHFYYTRIAKQGV